MRPYVVGGACHRVQKLIDTALDEGVLNLSPELAAHAQRCPQCGPHVAETEALFRRLRAVPAGFDLGPVPGVVDGVLQATGIGQVSGVAELYPRLPQADVSRRSHMRWVLGQVAAMAAVLALAAGGLTYLVLQVNHLAGGTKPAAVVERWVAPLHNWTEAVLKGTR